MMELNFSKSEQQRFWKEIKGLRVQEGERANLHKRSTGYSGKLLDKKRAQQVLAWGVQELAKLQDILYAHNQHGLLICLQAMDAAGKDGAIRHIMSGLNPQGVKVVPFKMPSAEELDHDFLWRHYKALPPRGEVGIFNRSHYENVLVSRVHPEILLRENLPGVRTVEDVKEEFWNQRYRSIKSFERIVHESGTTVIKFFLHLSKDEQRKRLLARIDDPEKNWKFSAADLKEREYWDAYQDAYEEVISATSTAESPWFVIPADDKWYTRVAIAAVIFHHMQGLGLTYPVVTKEQRKVLLEARSALL
jgi:PPK2 family polyphosphate:nucleotide phosphotransferase